jgi:hypothetical protein
MREFISGFFKRFWVWGFAIILSLILASFGYLIFIQTINLGRRELFFSALIWIVLTPLIYLLISRFLIPRLNEYNPRGKRIWLTLSTFVGLLFALGTRPPGLIILFPLHTLQISIPAGETDRAITLYYAKTSLRDIGFGEFTQNGDWQRTDAGLTHNGSGPAMLTWRGRVGDGASLDFTNTPALVEAQAGWDGQLSPLTSGNSSHDLIQVIYKFSLGWISGTVGRLITGFTAGFLFLAVTLFLAGVKLKTSNLVKHKKGYWLLYALPMIAVSVFFLLIFFPGLVPQDSLVQWRMVLTGQYSDQHPILYTLLIGLLSRIYNSPSSVAIAQILMISLPVAWGLAELGGMGVSRKILWVLAVLFAILPVNILSIITLRKDVLYSAAIFILSIMFLKIINSRGTWLKKPWTWLGMGLTLAVISLTRLNGLPVALGSIALLLIFYRQAWRRLAASAGIFAFMLVAMYGPVYSLLKVKHVSEFGTVVFLHHIAAHLDAGTPLDAEEADYLGRLAPLNSWDYNCCQANPTMAAIFPGNDKENYDLPLLKQDIQKPARIALDLFLKDPLVDLRHMACAGQLVWSLQSSCPDVIRTGIIPLVGHMDPETSFSILPNPMRFASASKIPGLIRFANTYLQIFSNNLIHYINFTMPIYLYLTIYCTALLAVRKKDWRILLFAAIIIIQSITLLLINISQTYRYQYGVFLVGLISIGFLFIPIQTNRSILPGSKTNDETKTVE